MTDLPAGRRAEQVAAAHLQANQFQIMAQNWRTRYCEIDLIASHQNIIYFVEVKYRRQSAQGTGLDYITAKKLQQMAFAAELWVQSYSWQGEYNLAALEVSGPQFQVTAFLDQL